MQAFRHVVSTHATAMSNSPSMSFFVFASNCSMLGSKKMALNPTLPQNLIHPLQKTLFTSRIKSARQWVARKETSR